MGENEKKVKIVIFEASKSQFKIIAKSSNLHKKIKNFISYKSAFKYFHFMPSFGLHIFFNQKSTEKNGQKCRRRLIQFPVSIAKVQKILCQYLYLFI
jgi:hypothetical protein